MYRALEQSVNSTDVFPAFTITEIMRSWIEQAGHPLLHVSVDNGTVTLTQVQKLFMLTALFCTLILCLLEYYSEGYKL